MDVDRGERAEVEWIESYRPADQVSPRRRRSRRARSTRAWLQGLVCVSSVAALLMTGCASSFLHWPHRKDKEIVEELERPRLVRDMTRVWGMRPATIEGVGLVTQLDNTGSDPPASSQRDVLISDMQRRGVEKPGEVLRSKSTSLVLVRATLPPGLQKGDRIDIEIMTPSRSETESLRGGWLMQTRLQELAVLANQIHSGREMAQAEGPLLTESLLENKSTARSETRGRILGGGVSGIDRTMGLVLEREHHSVQASALIGAAINTRFHMYDRGSKRGVATPKRDNFIDLAVHPRYRHNLTRYTRVVQAIPLRESTDERSERMEVLAQQLLDPETAIMASVDLEALGSDALPTLRTGLKSTSPLVRFAAAEAMAYMNEIEAVPTLTDAARKELAFRWHALTALSAMTESEAREGLAELMHESSDETRYGAFRALRHFNPRDPAVRGEVIGEAFTLHVVPTDAEPLVHIRRTELPEIVIFGKQIALQTPVALVASKRCLIKSDANGRLKVTYFSLGQADKSTFCDNDLVSLMRTLVHMGASYSDVVMAIQEAKEKDQLRARVKFDALPKPGRQYHFEDSVSESDSGEELPEGVTFDRSDDEADDKGDSSTANEESSREPGRQKSLGEGLDI